MGLIVSPIIDDTSKDDKKTENIVNTESTDNTKYIIAGILIVIILILFIYYRKHE